MWHPTATLKDAGPWRNDRAQLSPQVLVLDRLLLLGWATSGKFPHLICRTGTTTAPPTSRVASRVTCEVHTRGPQRRVGSNCQSCSPVPSARLALLPSPDPSLATAFVPGMSPGLGMSRPLPSGAVPTGGEVSSLAVPVASYWSHPSSQPRIFTSFHQWVSIFPSANPRIANHTSPWGRLSSGQ